MNKNRFGSLADELKARKTSTSSVSPSERPNMETSKRVDDETEKQSDVEPTQKASKRAPGKRVSGRVQIAGLIPVKTRDGVKVALAFESFDLSDLLTTLLDEWLESRPDHVRLAVKAKLDG